MCYVLFIVKPFVASETKWEIEIIIQCKFNVNHSVNMVVTIHIHVNVEMEFYCLICKYFSMTKILSSISKYVANVY